MEWSEVWIAYENEKIGTFTHEGQIKQSTLAANAQSFQ